MPATIGDAFVLLNNSILGAVGRFDEMSGASSRVAEAIIWVANAIDDGTLSVERMLAMAVAMGSYMAGAWVASFVAAHGAVATLTAGLGLLRAAMITPASARSSCWPASSSISFGMWSMAQAASARPCITAWNIGRLPTTQT